MRSDFYSKMLVDYINTLFCVRHHYKIDITKVHFVHFEIRFYHSMEMYFKIQCKLLSFTIGIKEENVSCWGFFCAQVVIAKCSLNLLFCVRHHYKIHIIEVYVVHFEIRFYHVMVINRKIQCKLSSTIGIKE